MSKWRKLRELSWAYRRLLLQAAALLIYAKLRLPFIDFRAVPAAGATAQSAAPSETMLARAQSIARVVSIAAAHCPVTIVCLHRSLVLWWLLRRNGIPCALRLGARTEYGPFEAHAWVQCAGVALDQLDAHLLRYRPFGEAVVPVGRRQPWRLVTRRVP